MAKTLGLEKVKIYDPRDLKKVAAIHLRYFKNRVQEKGQDKDGQTFNKYSDKYAKLKANRFAKKDGGRYASLKGQPISSTRVTPPDFTLTGKTMKALHDDEIRSDGYKLTWKGEAGRIVKGNKERGRDILGVPEEELKRVVDQVNIQFEKHLKLNLKDINITVG